MAKNGQAPRTDSDSSAKAKADAERADGWLADDTLFPDRPPIVSHRRIRRSSRPFVVAAVVMVVAAVTWTLIGGWGGSVPQHTVAPPPPAGPGLDGVSGPVGLPTTGQPSVGSSPSAPRSTPPRSTPPRTTPSAPGGTTASPIGLAPTVVVRTTVTAPETSQPTHATTPPATPPPAPPPPAIVTSPADGMVVRVVSLSSGQSMSVAADSRNDGALIVQSKANSSAQRWRLVGVSGGCFQLLNQYTTEALDDPDGSTDDGTQMQQWSYAPGNLNQSWCFYSVASGRFSIRNAQSGSLLDLRNGPTGGGAIQEWGAEPDAPNLNQTWQLVRTG